MKYACKFYQGCPMLQTTDEIIIKYNKKDLEIFDFVQKWKQEQRIILNITELEDDLEKCLEIFTATAKLHNIAVMCSKKQNYSLLAEECIPFFFIEKCGTFDELVGQLRLKVSDVYVVNELGFYLPEVAALCKDKNVNVRAIPNVAQSSSEIAGDDFSKFFIRPDDVRLYEEYVDIFEFGGDRLDIQNTLYQIYKEEKWEGNLAMVITGLSENIPNDSILPLFGETRLKCKKKCCFGKCEICKTIKSISKKLDEKEIHFAKE